MRFSTIEQTLDYIEHKTNFQLGLLRVEKFLEKAKIPFQDLNYIHVGGTNGKGSVSFYLSNIFIKQGYKTGFFSSPSIQGHNDRIRINNEFIDDKDIINFVNEYYDLIEETEVTMFEIDVLMALDYFVKNKVEYVIMEVGMGGRYDGTNVINPLVSIITNVGMDHVQYLGDTKEEIAYNKAGIIKKCGLVVTNEIDEKALKVIEDYALEKKACLFKVKEALVKNTNPIVFDYKSHLDIQLKTPALYQIKNASTVLETIDVLRGQADIVLDEDNIKYVFKNMVWPGRFEVMSTSPTVVIDGAHNMEGVNALATSLCIYDDKDVTILFTALKDKDTKEMIKELDKNSDHLLITEFDFYRAATTEMLDPENKYKHIKDYKNYIIEKTKSMNDNEVLVITGSLYFITEVRKILLDLFNN